MALDTDRIDEAVLVLLFSDSTMSIARGKDSTGTS
jgi:hypothetical protein